jgi:hypothetical protein
MYVVIYGSGMMTNHSQIILSDDCDNTDNIGPLQVPLQRNIN